MHWPCGCVESPRINEQESAFSRCYHGELRESYIIADSQPDFSIFGQIEDGDFVAGRENIALFERDLARYVNIEQVGFPVCGDQFACW